MLELIDEIGRGKERICFLHPQDQNKIIKVVHTLESKQMIREIQIYRELEKRQDISYEHIPKYYGEVTTDKGIGHIFDLARNSDGSAPKTLHWHIKNGTHLGAFHAHLEKLRAYLLQHSIVFCNDMSYDGNILVTESDDGSLKLIIVDGLGDVAFIKWDNYLDYFVKKKIDRRWKKLMQRLDKFEAQCKQ